MQEWKKRGEQMKEKARMRSFARTERQKSRAQHAGDATNREAGLGSVSDDDGVFLGNGGQMGILRVHMSPASQAVHEQIWLRARVRRFEDSRRQLSLEGRRHFPDRARRPFSRREGTKRSPVKRMCSGRTLPLFSSHIPLRARAATAP